MKILFINGAEIVTVSKLMGHRSQKTTRQYILANG
jgi:integrase